MSLAVDVVKRGKRVKEAFDADKLRASIYAACLSARSLDGVADDTARQVTQLVIVWAKNKPEITSADIRTHAARFIQPFNPDAAHLYKHHKMIM